MMGGPIDTRRARPRSTTSRPTKPLSWFENNVIHHVPSSYPGPRSPRLSGLPAARRLRRDEPRAATSPRTGTTTRTWCKGDLDDADAHRRFYDEYNAVLDMPAEYYLETVAHRVPGAPAAARPVGRARRARAPVAIHGTALLTIEGELDDISGQGQTRAAHDAVHRCVRSRRGRSKASSSTRSWSSSPRRSPAARPAVCGCCTWPSRQGGPGSWSSSTASRCRPASIWGRPSGSRPEPRRSTTTGRFAPEPGRCPWGARARGNDCRSRAFEAITCGGRT